jgi:hypothetical protein
MKSGCCFHLRFKHQLAAGKNVPHLRDRPIVERSALSRLDDILGSETRTAVATHDLVEIIRVAKGRQPLRDTELDKKRRGSTK